MFKGLITTGSYTSGNIPVSQFKNTNSNFSLNNNAISIKNDGVVTIKANVIVSMGATGGTITAQLYGNGSPISGALVTTTLAQNGVGTLGINDVVVVSNQLESGYASLSVQLNAACTIEGGDIICDFAG